MHNSTASSQNHFADSTNPLTFNLYRHFTTLCIKSEIISFDYVIAIYGRRDVFHHQKDDTWTNVAIKQSIYLINSRPGRNGNWKRFLLPSKGNSFLSPGNLLEVVYYLCRCCFSSYLLFLLRWKKFRHQCEFLYLRLRIFIEEIHKNFIKRIWFELRKTLFLDLMIFHLEKFPVLLAHKTLNINHPLLCTRPIVSWEDSFCSSRLPDWTKSMKHYLSIETSSNSHRNKPR